MAFACLVRVRSTRAAAETGDPLPRRTSLRAHDPAPGIEREAWWRGRGRSGSPLRGVGAVRVPVPVVIAMDAVTVVLEAVVVRAEGHTVHDVGHAGVLP